MHVITTTDELATFSTALRARPFFCVDTEFMREKTYWPVLCLIQAAAEGMEAIIDPLAEGIDLSPFLEAMADQKVEKIFHAARQDLEIFTKLMGEVPRPIFDSQIAAMACGFGDQIGYEPLMRALVNAKIDKGSRFTDWSRRPLSKAQLNYAMSDVTYLREAAPLLKERLEKDDRHEWVGEEADKLLDPGLYLIEPDAAWKRLKIRGLRKPELGPFMRLAAWREREAQEKDIPRNRVMKDEGLFELARLRPTTPKELVRARSISSGMERSKSGAAILAAIAEGVAIPKENLPALPDDRNRPSPPADVTDLLKVLLKHQCERYQVAPKLIASASDIDAIALDDHASVPALEGWRREVFGALALQLKHGEIALKLKNGAIELAINPDQDGQQ